MGVRGRDADPGRRVRGDRRGVGAVAGAEGGSGGAGPAGCASRGAGFGTARALGVVLGRRAGPRVRGGRASTRSWFGATTPRGGTAIVGGSRDAAAVGGFSGLHQRRGQRRDPVPPGTNDPLRLPGSKAPAAGGTTHRRGGLDGYSAGCAAIRGWPPAAGRRARGRLVRLSGGVRVVGERPRRVGLRLAVLEAGARRRRERALRRRHRGTRHIAGNRLDIASHSRVPSWWTA